MFIGSWRKMVEEKITETLPYGISVEKVFLVLDEIKKRPSITEDELALRIGKSYSKAKNAAVELKLIAYNNNQPVLSSTGKHIAWEINESAKKKLIYSCIIQKFRPYEIALSRMVREEKETIPTEFIQQIWAREMNFKLGEDNLARAVAFFFQILDLTGLGDTYIGRHGQKTRFSFKIGAKDAINNFAHETVNPKAISKSEKIPPTSDNTDSMDIGKLSENDETRRKSTTSIEDKDIDAFDAEPNWSILKTDYFILKIQNRPDIWDLLTEMIPLYRKTLSFTKKQNTDNPSLKNDTKMDVTPSE
jgi:hypothetical protein